MKNKYWNLSLYRLLAIICAIQFHIFFILYSRDIPFETLLSAGVIGLTCLSGFLHSQKKIEDIKSFYLKRFWRLIIPALACFLMMIIGNLIYMIFNKNYDFISLFFDHRPYNGTLLFQAGNYYYILYIFICYLLTPLLQRNSKWRLILLVTSFIVELTLCYFIFASLIVASYVIGYIIGKKSFDKYVSYQRNSYYPRLIIWLSLVAIFTISFVLVMNNFSLIYRYMKSILRGIIFMGFAISTFYSLSLLFIFLNKIKNIPLFSFTDKTTYYIFLLNQSFMCGGLNVACFSSSYAVKHVLVYIFVIGVAIGMFYIVDFITKIIVEKKKQKE